MDVAFLLHVAELLPGDPQVDDLGPLYAAIGRVQAHAMDRDVYGSDHLKAAALLQTLVRLPCLEHSNEAFAWHATEAFLFLCGHQLDYPPKEAVVLVNEATHNTIGIRHIARRLRDWTTTTPS
ncbi:fic family toxin-antitoxin system, toxin component [Embleya sp. NPDC055664]|uniref:fic family toxin-antitoxin system, toxin component n=1 Tax=Embleya sp. NPDC059237 TaxID=3346784 RepID=UPI00367A2D7F